MGSDARGRCVGDYFALQRGQTYKSRLLGLPGPFLLGLASIQRNGGFRSDSLRTYGGESDEKLLVKPGDLYVSLKDVTQAADLLGAVARFPHGLGIGRLTQDTVKLIPRTDDVPSPYLYWLMRGPHYRSYCRSRSTGTTNLGLRRDDFLAYPVPPLTDVRQRIVSALESLDDKIVLNQRIATTQRELSRAIFREWCSPPSGSLPAEWRALQVGDIADVNSRSLSRPPDSAIQYVDISTVSTDRIGGPTVYLENAPGRARRLVRDGDTIWSMVRPNRRSHALVQQPPENLVVSTGFAVLSPKDVPFTFLYEALTTDRFVSYLGGNATGSAYPAVRPQTFEQAPLQVPPEETLERFHQAAEPLWRDQFHRSTENLTLAELRDTLLPKLISGQLRVDEAEKIVEDVA